MTWKKLLDRGGRVPCEVHWPIANPLIAAAMMRSSGALAA